MLLTLYWTFFWLGLVTIGGGYAMLPIIQREVVEKRHWATDQQVTDIFAIGQCTPGVIAVNTATFIGYLKAGLLGGIIATLGLVTAPIIIITILAAFLQNFAHIPAVQNAFAGIRVCVVVLIFKAILKLWKNSVNGIFGILVFLCVLACSLLTELSSVLFVLAAAVAGIILALLQGKGRKKAE